MNFILPVEIKLNRIPSFMHLRCRILFKLLLQHKNSIKVPSILCCISLCILSRWHIVFSLISAFDVNSANNDTDVFSFFQRVLYKTLYPSFFLFCRFVYGFLYLYTHSPKYFPIIKQYDIKNELFSLLTKKLYIDKFIFFMLKPFNLKKQIIMGCDLAWS